MSQYRPLHPLPLLPLPLPHGPGSPRRLKERRQVFFSSAPLSRRMHGPGKCTQAGAFVTWRLVAVPGSSGTAPGTEGGSPLCRSCSEGGPPVLYFSNPGATRHPIRAAKTLQRAALRPPPGPWGGAGQLAHPGPAGAERWFFLGRLLGRGCPRPKLTGWKELVESYPMKSFPARSGFGRRREGLRKSKMVPDRPSPLVCAECSGWVGSGHLPESGHQMLRNPGPWRAVLRHWAPTGR